MNVKDKGFKLIMAFSALVIVILFIIIFLIVINHNKPKASEKVFKARINNLVSNAKNYYSTNKLRIKENVIFDYSNGGINDKGEKLSATNKQLKSGSVIITPSGNINLVNITDGNYYANYVQDKDKKIIISRISK